MDNDRKRAGDPLVISASDWNDLRETHRRLISGELAGPFAVKQQLDPSTLRVKNTTGADLPRFGIVALSDVVFTPTDNLTQFLDRCSVFQAVAPATSKQAELAILIEPLKAGAIGRAQVAGITPLKINVVDEANRWAIPTTDTTRLTARPFGTSLILWKEAGTGEKWAIVRLGMISPPFRIQFPGAVANDAAGACRYYTTAGLSTETVSVTNRSGGTVGAAGRIGYAFLNPQERETQFIQEACP
jgi:hypothetical protein